MNTSIEQAASTIATPPTPEIILALLRGVLGPHAGLDIVTLGWGGITIAHPQVTVALHPPGPIGAPHCAIEVPIERMLQPHLGTDRLHLRVRWDTGWYAGDD